MEDKWISVKDAIPIPKDKDFSHDLHLKVDGLKRGGYYDYYLECYFLNMSFGLPKKCKPTHFMPMKSTNQKSNP